jgi:hypothetical protein
MKKAVFFTLLGLVVLFGVSLVASFHLFQAENRLQVDRHREWRQPGGKMSWGAYKKVKYLMGSFDLANGLTKTDLENMRAGNHEGFYYLMGCLWLVLGLRLGLRRPRPRARSGAEGAG